MFKKNLGNLVASEMDSILHGEEFNFLFKKEAEHRCSCGCDECSVEGDHKPHECKCASKKSDEKIATATSHCPCPKSCACWEKHGEDHSASKCGCPKEKEAFEDIAQRFLKLSEDLDSLSLGKTSQSVLNAFDTMMSEAAELTVEEEDAEQALEDIPVEIVTDEEPLDPRLLETMEHEDPKAYSEDFLGEEEDFDLEEQLKALTEEEYPLMEMDEKSLEELLAELEGHGQDRSAEEKIDSLIEEAKEEYLPEKDVEIEALLNEVDGFLKQNSSNDDLELSADLNELLEADDDFENQLVSLAEDEDDEEEDEEEDFEDEE